MNKITIIGDGITKDFYFTFPFFTKNDIIVEKNSNPATGYGIFCNPSELNADFPFVGGRVHFAKAPKTGDVISIYRKLELNRHVDYQPTAALSPNALNQDMNFMIEVLKDIKNDLLDFSNKYSEITDSESIDTLLDRIDVVMDAIDDVTDKIDDLGDISVITTDISGIHTSLNNLSDALDSLTNSVGANTSSITGLTTFKNEVSDYVVASQAPTANNDYMWYRKYKSGWVEQGQIKTTAEYGSTGGTITLPIEMADTNYQVLVTQIAPLNTNMAATVVAGGCVSSTTTIFIGGRWVQASETAFLSWVVKGFAA